MMMMIIIINNNNNNNIIIIIRLSISLSSRRRTHQRNLGQRNRRLITSTSGWPEGSQVGSGAGPGPARGAEEVAGSGHEQQRAPHRPHQTLSPRSPRPRAFSNGVGARARRCARERAGGEEGGGLVDVVEGGG
eukprot:839541-Rhodomonas_salina.2